jgi:hypothetical protein
MVGTTNDGEMATGVVEIVLYAVSEVASMIDDTSLNISNQKRAIDADNASLMLEVLNISVIHLAGML